VAFEVNSPGDRRTEVQSKTTSWLEAGTRVVVIIDPLRGTASVHRAGGTAQQRSGAESLDLDDVLPGFAPTVDDLLA
jgi:Uma2 family endonuclease